MALTKKTIKYILKNSKQKSVSELSRELNIPEQEITGVLNPEPIRKNITSADSIVPLHTILIFIQCILIFIAPLVCMNGTWFDFSDLAQGLYIQSISGIMLFLWLLDCFINKSFEIKKSVLYFPVVGILLWSGLSFIWATNCTESLGVMSQWVACGVIFFVVYNMVKSSLDVSLIMGAMMASMGYLILIGLIQYYDPSFNLYVQAVPPSGTFANKNMFCDYLIIVLPICFYFFMNGLDKTRFYIRVISGLIFISGILFIVFSKTRAEMLAFPLLLLIFLIALITLRKKNKDSTEIFSRQKVVVFIFLASMFVIVLISDMLLRKDNQVDNYVKLTKSAFVLSEKEKDAFSDNIADENLKVTSSATHRLITWANTLKMVQDKPLIGYGLYNWKIHYGEYRRALYNDPFYMAGSALDQVHNDYLQILVDLGLVGFLLFAWLIVTPFIMFKKIFFSTEDSLDVKLKALSLILGVIGFGIGCFFSFLIVRAVPSFLLFIFIALIINIFYYSKANQKRSSYLFNSKFAGLLLLPVFVIFVFVISLEMTRGKVDKLYKIAMDGNMQQKLNASIKAGEEILEINPLHYKTHFVLTYAYLSTKEYDKAAEQVEKGLVYYPNDLVALFHAGSIYTDQLKLIQESKNPDINKIISLEEKAIKRLGKAIEMRNDFGEAMNKLGLIYLKRSERLKNEGKLNEVAIALKEAESNFDKAIAHDPLFLEATWNKANILESNGRGNEAIDLAIKVLQLAQEKIEKSDNTLNEFIKLKMEQNTAEVKNAIQEQSSARQHFIFAAPNAIKILRFEYGKNKNNLELLKVYETEQKFIELQFNKKTDQMSNLKNKSEESVSSAKKTMALDEIDFNQKKARLMLDTAEANRLLGNKDEYLLSLEKVIELSNSKSIPEQETLARLKVNDYFLSNLKGKDLIAKISVIEENFKKAIFQENPLIIKGKEALEKNFKEIKKSLNIEK